MIYIKNKNNLNNIINLSIKILKLLYVLLISGIILFTIFVIKELKILCIFNSILCVLIPLFIGFIIAWLFNPLVNKIYNKGIPKIISILIVYIVIIFFICIFFRIFIPVLYKQLNDLILSLPGIINKINNTLDDLVLKFKLKGIDISSIKNNTINCINNMTINITSNLPKTIINIIISFISYLGIISIGLVIGIYILLDFDNIKSNFIKIIPFKNKNELTYLTDKIGVEVRKTINGTLLVALMVLVGDTILFSIIGLESPLLFGVFCGLTDLIPYIGPYIGGIPAVIVGFTQGSKIGIAVLISCIIVQLIENYILQPIVMSKTIEINPIIIIIGLLLFGHFFGIIGMIVASPILAILKVIYDYYINKYRN